MSCSFYFTRILPTHIKSLTNRSSRSWLLKSVIDEVNARPDQETNSASRSCSTYTVSLYQAFNSLPSHVAKVRSGRARYTVSPTLCSINRAWFKPCNSGELRVKCAEHSLATLIRQYLQDTTDLMNWNTNGKPHLNEGLHMLCCCTV